MTRNSYGVLKKHQRKIEQHPRQGGPPFTYYGREDRCAICDVSFDELLNSDADSGEWTFHWNSDFGAVIIAETCSKAHAEEFEVWHREEVKQQWDDIVDLRQGRQIASREAGRRQILGPQGT